MPGHATDIPLQARRIAHSLRHAPETRRRLAPTERIWQYRAYQGSDPVSMVDWRQSARTPAPIVREHEPLRTTPVYIWAGAGNPMGRLVLLSLAYLLAYKERRIGWLGGVRPATATASQIAALLPDTTDTRDLPALAPLRHAFLVIADDFDAPSAARLDILRRYSAQGNRLLLVHTGKQHIERVQNWPVLVLSETAAPDGFVAELLALTVKETR